MSGRSGLEPTGRKRALADEFRLVAYDLRGHGMSAAPPESEHYPDGKLWAGDLAAIIEELRLDRTVLVGWSYGAFVICDFVRAYGQQRIAAINFVEGAVRLGEAAFGSLIGPGVGHVPHLEEPGRFNRELAELTRRART